MEAKQTDLARLLTGTKAFVVPRFQRHYKWKRPEWDALLDDILDQYNEPQVRDGNFRANEGHFLGSVVLHPMPGPASTVLRYWVIDGQQRLTTLVLLIAAFRDVRANLDDSWSPEEYNDQYLRNKFSSDRPYRLSLGESDNDDFISTVYNGTPRGLVGDAYAHLKGRLIEMADAGDLDLPQFDRALFLRLLLVEISTSSDDNINQIFHTINHSGMKLSSIDLIRNHAFMQLPEALADEFHDRYWKPLEASFSTESGMSRYLAAQLTRAEPKARQKDLYQPFVNLVNRESVSNRPQDQADATIKLLRRLHDEASFYLAITDPERSNIDFGQTLRQSIENLATWNSIPSQPLALEIVARVANGEIEESDAAMALDIVLSFLVRRALVGTPTNNLNRQLSPIPRQLKEGAVAGQLISLLSASSRYWPTDSELVQRIPNTPLYINCTSNQIRIILWMIERSFRADELVEYQDLTVEHIQPQALTEDWVSMLLSNGFTVDDALSRRHVLGNLALTGNNAQLAQLPFLRKAEILSNSNIASNRDISALKTWTPADIDRRSDFLAKAATKIFTGPIEIGDNEDHSFTDEGMADQAFSVESSLNSLDASSWTTIDALVELTQLSHKEVQSQVRLLGYPMYEYDGKIFVPGDPETEETIGPDLNPVGARDLSEQIQFNLGDHA